MLGFLVVVLLCSYAAACGVWETMGPCTPASYCKQNWILQSCIDGSLHYNVWDCVDERQGCERVANLDEGDDIGNLDEGEEIGNLDEDIGNLNEDEDIGNLDEDEDIGNLDEDEDIGNLDVDEDAAGLTDADGWCILTGYFIDRYAKGIRTSFFELDDAKSACKEDTQCGGVTYEPEEGGVYTLRDVTGEMEEGERGENSWLKGGCPVIGGGSTGPREDICISNCYLEYDFVKSYFPLTGGDALCDNDVTNALSGRGGGECRADPWFVVDACDPNTCYEFVWRASYPSYCDVEDRWEWCCDPKIELEDLTVCKDNRYGEMACIVQYDYNKIDNIKISWFDEFGNDLAYMSGFDVTIPWQKVDDDKLLSILSVVGPSTQEFGVYPITCRVIGDTQVWSETSQLTIFDIVTYPVIQPSKEEATIVCRALGSDVAWAATAFRWKIDTLDGQITLNLGDNEYGYAVDVIEVDGFLISTLTVSPDVQNLGDQTFTCELSTPDMDKCGRSRPGCIEEAVTTLTIWDLEPDHYCAHVGETSYLKTIIRGSNPSWPEDVVEFITPDGVTISVGDDIPGYTIFREIIDGEVVAILEIDASLVDEVGVFEYEAVVTYGGEQHKIVNELVVMDIISEDPEASQTDDDTDIVVLTATVSGGTLENPTWRDPDGVEIRTLPGDYYPEYTVFVSEDGLTTSLQINSSALLKPGVKRFEVTVDLVDSTGYPCREGITDFILDPVDCNIEWEDKLCDADRVTCSDTVHQREWNCVCSGLIQGTCEEPVPEIYTCLATEPFEISEWSAEICDRDQCYPYRMEKTRSCICRDDNGDYENELKCSLLFSKVEDYYCAPTIEWEFGQWNLGSCNDANCYGAETVDSRSCLCGEYEDSTKCDPEGLSRVRFCEATEVFVWSEWDLEDCSGGRCYGENRVKTRKCSCRQHEDNFMCEGSNEQDYFCSSNIDWVPTAEDSVCDDADSCLAYTAIQQMYCLCSSPEGPIVDDEQCEGQLEIEVSCLPSKDYEWSEWAAISDCDACFPDRSQTFVRQCSCDNDIDDELCYGLSEKSESCPVPDVDPWTPTEWVVDPCGELNCREPRSTTSKSRDCECDGNIDNLRCEGEELVGTELCELQGFAWSAWTARPCLDVCYTTTTKRYRICECHNEVDFNECPGSAIEFTPCDLPASCTVV